MIIARGPLKKTHASTLDSGVRPRKYADDCFSYSASSRATRPERSVPKGWSPPVASSCCVVPSDATAFMPSHANSESSTDALRDRPPTKMAFPSVRKKSALDTVHRVVLKSCTAPYGRRPQSPPLGTSHRSNITSRWSRKPRPSSVTSVAPERSKKISS